MFFRYSAPIALTAVVSLAPATASATYSIIGADTVTKDVGAVSTSCVEDYKDKFLLEDIYHSLPGNSVMVTQANAVLFADLLTDADAVIAQGLDAPATLAALKEKNAFYSQGQYGVVNVSGSFASYTSAANFAFACDASKEGCGEASWSGAAGASDQYTFSAQGNILTGAPVLANAAEAFRASGCDLPARLMRALEAGAKEADGELQGDSRCTPFGTPGDSAFLRVQAADGTPVIDISAMTPCACTAEPCTCEDGNAVKALRVKFDAWRADHPCAGGDDESDGGGDSGADDGGGCSIAKARPSRGGHFGVIGVLGFFGLAGMARLRRRSDAGVQEQLARGL